MRKDRTGPFSASGTLELTSDGPGRALLLSDARPFAPRELHNSLVLLLGESTPGFYTPDQSFAGTLTDSDWEVLHGARVTVAHNSWFTADIPTMLGDPNTTETPIVGLAWGTYDLENSDGDFYQGTYALLIGGAEGGVLAINPSCYPSPVLGEVASGLMGEQVEVHAAIKDLTDTGGFTLGPAAATGEFRKIGDTGTVVVSAEGCLGQEVATFTVNSFRESD